MDEKHHPQEIVPMPEIESGVNHFASQTSDHILSSFGAGKKAIPFGNLKSEINFETTRFRLSLMPSPPSVRWLCGRIRPVRWKTPRKLMRRVVIAPNEASLRFLRSDSIMLMNSFVWPNPLRECHHDQFMGDADRGNFTKCRTRTRPSICLHAKTPKGLLQPAGCHQRNSERRATARCRRPGTGGLISHHIFLFSGSIPFS